MGTMSKEEILKILEDAKDKNSDVPMRLVRQAFEKLREPCEDAISRQAACEYCHEDSDGYVTPIEKNSHAFIRFGMDGWELDLKANGWHGSAKIKYCPMCGRSLTHE